MKKISKRILAGISAIMVTLTGVSNVAVIKAAESSNTEQIVLSTEDIKDGPIISQTVTDREGNEGVLEITEVLTNERAAARTWKVSFTSGVVNCHFYMKVSNNKCTSAYNKKILTVGCTYSNVKLTRTSTYARLSMDISALKDLAKFNGWLQGKVTGKNNNIKVTYSF